MSFGKDTALPADIFSLGTNGENADGGEAAGGEGGETTEGEGGGFCRFGCSEGG